MSLLLDALKKAEREKQKAREAESSAVESDDPQPGQRIASETFPEQQRSDQHKTAHEETYLFEELPEELELIIDEPPAQSAIIEETEQEEIKAEAARPSLSPSIELEKSSATTSTVSDKALQLLVHKTNKRYHQRQKLVWGSLLSAAAVILLTAGAYYYYDALEEVESLERKHKMAMQAVHAEPIKQRQVSAVSDELIGSAASIQSSEIKPETKRIEAQRQAIKTARPPVEVSEIKQDFSVKQTTKEDPINALLRKAWLAYNRTEYAVAGQTYENVLKREPMNRDALLGMAAIAVKTADYKKAKDSYRLLLKLDPRDQVAMAAMSNIDELSTNSQDESKLKFMLQQQPSATHLNFALGNYYAKKGRWPEAQAEYFKAWQGDSENADYVYNLAVSLDQLGKPKEALRFYKDSLMFGSGKNIGFSITDVENRIEAISTK